MWDKNFEDLTASWFVPKTVCIWLNVCFVIESESWNAIKKLNYFTSDGTVDAAKKIASTCLTSQEFRVLWDLLPMKHTSGNPWFVNNVAHGLSLWGTILNWHVPTIPWINLSSAGVFSIILFASGEVCTPVIFTFKHPLQITHHLILHDLC